MNDTLENVFGADKGLADILTGKQVVPLLKAVVSLGAHQASIVDCRGKEIWAEHPVQRDSDFSMERPLEIEGEAVGYIRMSGDELQRSMLDGMFVLLGKALDTLICTSLKQVLAAEIHTQVVDLNYEELLEKNRQLQISEQRYRELSESLEEKVRERTGELKRAYTRLLQQEKMAGISRLAAGMAHEINNPLAFIKGNIQTFGKYWKKCRDMLDCYQGSDGSNLTGEEIIRQGRKRWDEGKIGYIMSDTDDLIDQTLQGVERISRIVSSLKDFSHIDESALRPADLNAEIDRSIAVLLHEIPQDAHIIREYGEVPPFHCNPALLCQVFYNIILNAVQARPAGLILRITTEYRGESIRIGFKDNGPGIDDKMRSRIFEPFFTTREVGKGQGMGLAVAYDVIRSYDGSIDLAQTDSGSGSCFVLNLPMGRSGDV